MMSETNVLKMKVADLKRELKLRGLPTNGNKEELQERLQASIMDGDLLEDAAIAEELLDEVLTDEDEKIILESPIKEKELLPETKSDIKSAVDNTTLQQKKVVLKRKNSLTNPTPIGTATKFSITKEDSHPVDKVHAVNEVKTDVQKSENNNNVLSRKKIKISELSMKERLEMRAKKFGMSSFTPPPTNDKTNSTTGNGTDKDGKLLQALKKRAERFGCVLSSNLVEIEKRERLRKRQERFGIVTSSTPRPSLNAKIYEEKAKLRLERFKTK